MEFEPRDVCGELDVSILGDETDVDKYDEETQEETTLELHEWKKRNSFINAFDPDRVEPLSNVAPQLMLSSPIELFYLMFPKERMQYYVEMTKRYATQKGRNLEDDGDDIEQFFGILLFSGYHSVPSENMFCSTSEELIIPLVSGTMNRNRFRELKRNFHTMDNTELLPGDKLGKISGVYADLNNRLRQFGIFHEQLSIDEEMVPYYGHHSCKMFIRGKPIRFSYKIWTMASANGYPYALKIYSGRDENRKTEPLGMQVIDLSNTNYILTTFSGRMIFLRSLQGKRFKQREPSGTCEHESYR
ncbi:PiggyBac transposable element-derived protein 3 [Trichinella zimbabwensis]|uniref:PiggyBac transposable element-derived protein 3 n=1 Tax=Trichinella zimbabwensis TaxID=268475 RepID=A0A0V1GWI8_9BILA|nr:PiggyBac transposable element-derived protein 3 [Trichinella zimbabwensis]